MSEPPELAEQGLGLAQALGARDACVLAWEERQDNVRFANNSLSLALGSVKRGLTLCLNEGRRRIVGTTTSLDMGSLREYVSKLLRALSALEEGDAETTLERPTAKGGAKGYEPVPPERLADAAREAIDGALAAGAQRVTGIISQEMVRVALRTSSGFSGEELYGGIILNVRAFADKEASGHGLGCGTSLKALQPARAGREAGEDARRMLRRGPVEEGEYEVLFHPTVAAHLMEHVGSFASAYLVEIGQSFLANALGKQLGVEALSLCDTGSTEGALVARSFDDEGMATRTTAIIEKGVARSYLHNLVTARRFGAQSTGNAGFVVPRPWNLVVEAGDASLHEMLAEVKRGLLVTNTWYTRFQNYLTGEFSTMPRDGVFLVEKGEIRHGVGGIRLSSALPAFLANVRLVGKERRWVKWWEVETPTLCPAILAGGFRVTRALF
jgi:PmbA protein